MEIIQPKQLPNWLSYPQEYLKLVEQNIVEFLPWYLLNAKLAQLRYDGLRSRYPDRHLFAFAARRDNDDIACWENGKPGRVVIIHDFASEKFADRGEYPCLWDWFRSAIEEMIAFND